MGADLAGTSSPYVSPSFSTFFYDIFTKWKLLKKERKKERKEERKLKRCGYLLR